MKSQDYIYNIITKIALRVIAKGLFIVRIEKILKGEIKNE